MKTTISIVALLIASQANAATFEYACAQKGGEFPMRLQINEKQMTILDVVEGNGSVKRGNLGFFNKGLKGGSGKMADQIVYDWSKAISTVYNWDLAQTFFVQPAMLTGGARLGGGRIGGFISFVGGGYSYESYLCILK